MVLFAENVIISLVFEEAALNLQIILTSTPAFFCSVTNKSKRHFNLDLTIMRIIFIGFFTRHEVAVFGETVVGAEVAINKTHYSDICSWFG